MPATSRRPRSPIRSRGAFFASLALLICDAILDIVAVARGDLGVRTITKPLLMPLLACVFLIAMAGTRGSTTLRRLVLADLLFSCAGDTVLLQRDDVAFAYGSAWFACAHVAAIAAFVHLGNDREISNGRGFVRAHPWVLALFALAWIVPNAVLFPHLGLLAYVVFPYSALLLTMAAFALDTLGRVPNSIALPFITGAATFVQSDSTIAFARFDGSHHLPGAETFIIAAYLGAQVMLVGGFVKAAELTRDGARTSAPSRA